LVQFTRKRNEYLFEGPEDELKRVKRAITFKDPNLQSKRIYGNTSDLWNGRVYLGRKRSFNHGFIGLIRRMLDAEGIEHKTLGEPNYPIGSLTIPDMFSSEERAYQAEAMKRWMNLRYGIIKASTRSGKTLIFSHIANALIEEQPNIKIAFLTESKDIFNQNIDEIAKFTGNKIGRISGQTRDIGENITCVMAQTVDAAFRLKKQEKGYRGPKILKYPQKAKAMQDLLKSFDMVCVDELHKFVKTKRRATITRFSSARYYLGLSATPFKKSDPLDSWRVYGILGGEVFRIGEKKLRQNGILTEDNIIFVNIPKYEKTISWPECYEANIVNSQQRLQSTVDIVNICKKLGLKVLLFADRINHGELYAEALGCNFVHGGHTDEERKQMKDDFLAIENGGVLVSSSIFLAGVSFTEVDCTIALAGGKEETRQQQRRGRALGVGKRSRSMTFDFLDREPKYLKEHSMARKFAYEAQSEGLKAKTITLDSEDKKRRLEAYMKKWFKL